LSLPSESPSVSQSSPQASLPKLGKLIALHSLAFFDSNLILQCIGGYLSTSSIGNVVVSGLLYVSGPGCWSIALSLKGQMGLKRILLFLLPMILVGILFASAAATIFEEFIKGKTYGMLFSIFGGLAVVTIGLSIVSERLDDDIREISRQIIRRIMKRELISNREFDHVLTSYHIALLLVTIGVFFSFLIHFITVNEWASIIYLFLIFCLTIAGLHYFAHKMKFHIDPPLSALIGTVLGVILPKVILIFKTPILAEKFLNFAYVLASTAILGIGATSFVFLLPFEKYVEKLIKEGGQFRIIAGILVIYIGFKILRIENIFPSELASLSLWILWAGLTISIYDSIDSAPSRRLLVLIISITLFLSLLLFSLLAYH